MKLTEEQKQEIKDAWGDWETVHGLCDNFAQERLTTLDPEWVKDMKKITKGATFWCA